MGNDIGPRQTPRELRFSKKKKASKMIRTVTYLMASTLNLPPVAFLKNWPPHVTVLGFRKSKENVLRSFQLSLG